MQFLAEKNLAFRGTNKNVRNESVHNGNFLGFVELVEKFDPVLDKHLRKIKTHEIHNHYLGKDTQNELLDIMATATLNEILKRVKAAKYYAIILDCTPDISHQEQMSLIIRYLMVTWLLQVFMNILLSLYKFKVAQDIRAGQQPVGIYMNK